MKKEKNFLEVIFDSETMAGNIGIVESEDAIDNHSGTDGYCADVEDPCYNIDEEDSSTDEGEKTIPSTFPVRRKRRRPEEESSQQHTSLLVLSKLLVQYWDAVRVPKQEPKKQKRLPRETTTTMTRQITIMPQVSCRHVSLEHALSFTPRILFQAEPPHAVVHANAAYSRLVGNTDRMHTNPHHQTTDNHVSLLNAIQTYFGQFHADDVTLTMYPVCSSSENTTSSFPTVTHYLVEATVSDADLSVMPAMKKETAKTTSLQPELPARAVG